MNDTLANGTNNTVSFTSSALALQITTSVIGSIKLILGLPVNSYVLWLILRGAGGTIASEFFYLNLIVSVILSALGDVFYFAWVFTYNAILSKVYRFIFVLFFWCSVPSFQCCICVERYIAVVHPVVFLRYKALRYRVACCCAVWLTALAFSLLIVILGTVYPLYFWLGFWVVCMSVVCFCCLSVLRALKQPGPGEGQRDSGEGNDLKRRAFRIILISLVVMSVTVISYIPTALFTLLKYSLTVVNTVGYTVATITTFVHPLLYLHKAGKLPCFKGP